MKAPQYYQFPLYLLGVSSDLLESMKHCHSYGLAVAGAHWSRKQGTETNDEEKFPQPDAEEIFSDQRLTHYLSCAFNAQVSGGDSFETHLIRAKAGYQYAQDLLDKFGNYPKVRIRRDLLDSGIHGTRGQRQQILVFLALLAVIGDKRGAVPCSLNRLIYCSSGCKSRGMFEAMNETGWQRMKPLSRNQVAYAVKQLELRGIIARFTALNRHSYYSHRMSKELLREAVLARYEARRRRRQECVREDAEVNLKIRKMRSGNSGHQPSRKDKGEDDEDALPF